MKTRPTGARVKTFPFFLLAFIWGGAVGVSALQAQETAPAAPVVAAPTQGFSMPLSNYGANNEAGVNAYESKRETRRAAMEARLRSMISGYGFSSTSTQDAIIEYLSAEGPARAPLNEASKRLISALKRDAPPERVRDLIGEYKNALEAERLRRATAQNALDAKIGYSLNPRLEALLWVSGVIGEGQTFSPQILNAPRENAYENPPQPSEVEPKRGVSIGNLLTRGDATQGEFWIEVGSERGERERFVAPWNSQTNSFDGPVLQSMLGLQVGTRLRVEWLDGARKRIVSLTPVVEDILRSSPIPEPEKTATQP